jgi:hypothetical protein
MTTTSRRHLADNQHRVRLGTLLIAVCVSLAVSACGSSSKPVAKSGIGVSPAGVKYSDCMRAHGVPNFPDLNANGSVSLPSNVNPDSPAFQGAEGTCASLRPRGAPPPPITLAQQKKFVANAHCMRKHVSNFPDPTFGPGGHGVGFNVAPGSVAYEAQGILRASRECSHVGSSLPLSGLVQGQGAQPKG